MGDKLLDRIDTAITRITSGHAAMRVPADSTDPDIVLTDCKVRIAALEARNAALVEALTKIKRGPVKPFPDPLAHSWHAYAEAVMAAWTDARYTAINALAALQDQPLSEG